MVKRDLEIGSTAPIKARIWSCGKKMDIGEAPKNGKEGYENEFWVVGRMKQWFYWKLSMKWHDYWMGKMVNSYACK